MANLRTLAIANELASRKPAATSNLVPGHYNHANIVVDNVGNISAVQQTVFSDNVGIVTNADGTAASFQGWTHQFGTVGPSATGVARTTLAVTFPAAFAGIPKVNCQPTNDPDSYGTAVFSCYPTDITATGFTVNLTCGVTIGGGGPTNIVTPTFVDWMADYAA